MIIRIVKMTFKNHEIESFKKIFIENQALIASFPGCLNVKLLQDKNAPNTMITLSHWESSAHLENYRNSTLFETTWARTKVLFDAKPEAWSVEEVRNDEL
jgi:heme-degrading monooxygenase HmoA